MTTTQTAADAIRTILAANVQVARAQGWQGEDDEYEQTAQDLEYVVRELGRKPTAEEWSDAGLSNVGGAHVAVVL